MSQPERLRFRPLAAPLHVVLVEPEIPPNTGAIARTCAATGSVLHLVGELGFSVDAQAVRRAGLDYWHLVDCRRHEDWDAFRRRHPDLRLRLHSARATRSYVEADYSPGDGLVFGRESVGLPEALLQRHASELYGIPTLERTVRSLNLSNAAAIVVYEALRQLGALSARETGDPQRAG